MKVDALYNLTILMSLTKRTTRIAFELVFDALFADDNWDALVAEIEPLWIMKK